MGSNNAPQTSSVTESNGDKQFAKSGTYEPLECEGRPCAKCGKCRDWYVNENQWVRRDGYTCTDLRNIDSLVYGDYGSHQYYPPFRSGGRDHRFDHLYHSSIFNSVAETRSLRGVCLCTEGDEN